jgi:hypothetical protein
LISFCSQFDIIPTFVIVSLDFATCNRRDSNSLGDLSLWKATRLGFFLCGMNVYCVHWNQAEEMLAKWQSIFSTTFTQMTCCAFCGSTALGGDDCPHSLVEADSQTTPFESANMHLERFTMTTKQSRVSWYACRPCAANKTFSNGNLVFQSASYLRMFLALHPLHVQMLSLIDVSVQMTHKFKGFAHGRLDDSSLLDCPLVV